MRVVYIINNYQYGAKYKLSPTDKSKAERIDRAHVKITYHGLTPWEIQLCNKLFCKRGKVVS